MVSFSRLIKLGLFVVSQAVAAREWSERSTALNRLNRCCATTIKCHNCILRVKVNGEYYQDVLLIYCLYLDVCEIKDYFIFPQDSAPAHRARDT